MPNYRTVQTTFSSGEFDQKLRNRSDTRAFFEGSQFMRNFALLSQGGFSRRPGTFLLDTIPSGRLIPFIYSATDSLLINIFATQLQVRGLDGQVQQLIATAPWQQDELFEIKYVQRGNAVIFTHQNWPAQLLSRNPDTGIFTLENYPYATNGLGEWAFPYVRKNTGSQNQFEVSSLASGPVTLTSTQDYFTANHVNTYVKVEGGYGQITGFTNAKTVTLNQISTPNRNLISDPLQSSAGSGILMVTVPGHSFHAGDTIVLEQLLPFAGFTSGQINNTHTIFEIKSGDTFTVNIGVAATDSEIGGGAIGIIRFTGPTPILYEQAFSAVNGYAGACAIHEERLWLGGTTTQPSGLWGSVVGEFDNFDTGEGRDAEAISIIIDSGEVNEIRHIVSSRHLQIMTNENEFYVPSRESAPITPATMVVRKQTPYGSSHVKASLFDGATLFCQENGRSVREFLYTDREFAYNARNIALLSQHLINEPKELVTIFGTAVRPEQYAFVLNKAGDMSVLHAIRSEELIGWANWETHGHFESVTVVGQRVFVISYHSGDALYYLEEFDFNFEHFMDGIIGLTSGSPTDQWTGVPEYANQTVAVTSGPYFLGYVDVDGSGSFQTDGEFTEVEVGLNFPAYAKTMNVTFGLPDGSMAGLPLKMSRVIVDFGASATMHVDGQRLILRDTTDFPPDVPDPMDQKVEFHLDKIAREAAIEFVSDIPLATAIYAMTIEVSF